MTRALYVALWAAITFCAACTSSNSSQPMQTGTKSYDSDYRIDSRGSQKYGGGQELSDRPLEDPPITVMLMSMETADVYPGDDYYVYAVVDNPDLRDLEYVWSVSNGRIAEVPEAERGRLATVVEEDYKNASATPAPSMEIPLEDTDPGAVTAEPGVQAEPGEPGTEHQPAPGVTQAPPNSGLPGGQQPSVTPATEDPVGEVSATDFSPGSPQGTYQDATKPETQDPGGSQQAGNSEITGTSDDSGVSPELQKLIDQRAALEIKLGDLDSRIDETNDPDDKQELIDERDDRKADYDGIEEQIRLMSGALSGHMVAGVVEQRVVAGDEDVSSENVEALAAQLAKSVTTSYPEGGVVRPEPEGVTVSVDQSPSSADWVGEEAAPLAPGRARGIRSEYSVWQDDSSEPRKRLLGGYGSLKESEALTAEESFEDYIFVTEEPYIMWTPSIPGQVNIHVKARYKDEEITEARTLPVEVRLRDPEVLLSEEFPDIVREDEFFFVALNATNIPAFFKGLFTVTFDPNRLSFRDAELGEFFDDTPGASLFYAEPDKMDGKVLLAIDSNRELTELGGEGVIVYAKFKAKQDISTRDETNIALVMDNSARYILDFNGENVLPLPVNRPAFRTDTIMPSDYPEYTREEGATPGTETDQQPGGQQVANQNRPGQQTRPQPQPTSSPGYQPSSTPTYTPPNNGSPASGSQTTTPTTPEDYQPNHSISVDEENPEETATGDKAATENGEVTVEPVGDAADPSAEGDGSSETATGETTSEGEATETGEETDTEPEKDTDPEPEPEPEGEGKG